MFLTTKGTGYVPDPFDPRDLHPSHDKVSNLLSQLKLPAEETLPSSVDLREWFPPVVDQGPINSCTANATAGLLGYFQNRAFGKYIAASRLFLYKVSRNLLFTAADQGAYLRTEMETLRLFGAPPEEYWPYIWANVSIEPPAFLYAFARNYRATQYYRYDPPGTTPKQLLTRVKVHLAAKLPAVFGFTLYPSVLQSFITGRIPFPAPTEHQVDGHALVAVGYDDNMVIGNYNPISGISTETVGALLVRNSWGPTWGLGGYGALPYEYIFAEKATDFWSLLDATWVDTGQFGGSSPQ